MRFLALCSVLALATLPPPSLCERRNPAVCSPDNDWNCPEGQRCAVPDGQAVGTCAPAECVSGAANSCPVGSPLCVKGLCTKCATNGECLALNPDAPLCDSGRCVACRLDGGDCMKDATKPVCDATTRTCRSCQLHSECASGVCAKDDTYATLSPAQYAIAKGSCVDSSRVNVCTSCDLSTMLGMSVDVTRPYVRVDSLTGQQKVTVPTLRPGLPAFYIIGPKGSSDLPPSKLTMSGSPTPPSISNSAGTALAISAGAHTIVEGLVISNSKIGIDCMSNGNTPTRVKLLRSLVGAHDIGIKTAGKCELSIDSSWIGLGPSGGPLAGVGGNILAMQLDSTQLDIVNTVLFHNGVALNKFAGISLSDSGGLSPSLRIANSSFVTHIFADTNQALAIYCNYQAGGSMSIVNTLFVNNTAPTSGTSYVHSSCRSSSSLNAVASNDASLTSPTCSNCITDVNDSILVSPGTGDLHLASSAPDSVANRGVLGITSVDMEGLPRGQTQVSIGAFEATR